jgi:hypothetical protein
MALFASGCGGDDIERLDLEGNATFAGDPIVYGTVEIVPEEGHKGPAGFAEIVQGKYNTQDGGKGILKGPHRVLVTAYSAKPEAVDTEGMANPPEPPMPLFRNYSLKLDLQSTDQNLEIPKEAMGHGLALEKGTRRPSNEP